MIKIAELKSGITAQTKYSSRDDLDEKYYINSGDILFSWSGSPDTSLDTFVWAKGCGLLNQHIFKVVTERRAETTYVYYLLKRLRNELIEIARNKQTTGLGHVTVGDMQRLRVCSPPDDIMEEFDRKCAPLFRRCYLTNIESDAIATLRDALLPKLLSGEIRVADAERTVETTV